MPPPIDSPPSASPPVTPLPVSRTAAIRRWFAWSMLVVIAMSVGVWFTTRGPLPREIRIATSPEGGLYHEVGKLLKPAIEVRTKRRVVLLSTQGSVENRNLLAARGAELAILQDGAVPLQEIAVIAPLYHDVVHVVVRRGAGIQTIPELLGRNVVLGREGSGMRQSAIVLLAHYGLGPGDLKRTDGYFGDLISDATLDAAIVTTGFLNGDLQKVMATRQFDLLPLRDAEALSIHHPYFMPRVIPPGVFEGNPPVPDSPIPTVATTAFLAARSDVPEQLVRRTLESLYEEDLRKTVPTLIPLAEARQMAPANLHPATRTYYDPYGGVELVSNLLESISAVKELLFAFCAGLFLLWDRWRRAKEREDRAALGALKERLDRFLEQTVRLEQSQMESDDPRQLRQYLDEVTRIKLQAIQELTHEDLRGDRMFSIFLLQCGDLAGKIQAKLNHRSRGP